MILLHGKLASKMAEETVTPSNNFDSKLTYMYMLHGCMTFI